MDRLKGLRHVVIQLLVRFGTTLFGDQDRKGDGVSWLNLAIEMKHMDTVSKIHTVAFLMVSQQEFFWWLMENRIFRFAYGLFGCAGSWRRKADNASIWCCSLTLELVSLYCFCFPYEHCQLRDWILRELRTQVCQSFLIENREVLGDDENVFSVVPNRPRMASSSPIMNPMVTSH